MFYKCFLFTGEASRMTEAPYSNTGGIYNIYVVPVFFVYSPSLSRLAV